jgi:hypothetical protein
MANLAETLRQVGYVTPQGQVTGPNAPLAQQLKNYVTNVIPTAAQNLAQQRSDIDAALTMGQGGVQIGDREAFERQMAQATNLGGVMKVSGAMKTAQKNAALPIEEGGLGLPATNTAADRANALGFRDFYHGTERLDRLLEGKTLDPRRATSGPMPFGASKPEVASNYAIGKADTSRIATDMGDFANYFQVSPKELGFTRSRSPYSVEQTWYFLSPEKKAEILEKAKRIGYEMPEEATGKFVLHETSEKAPFSQKHFDFTLQREAGGNPLKALRQLYAESGMLDAYAPKELADIYKLAGYPYQISQSNAPWTSAKGVLAGKSRITNPLDTSNADELQTKVLPALEEAFKNDRTRIKTGGADQWDKNTRYTPKQWVEQLKNDIANGENSYVWTSIPDKVTKQLEKLGYNGIFDVGNKGKMGLDYDVIIPFKPEQVRSRFAAFDPKKIDKPDLLAGAAAIPMATDEDNRRAILEKLFNEQQK